MAHFETPDASSSVLPVAHAVDPQALITGIEWKAFTAPAEIKMTSRIVALPLPTRVSNAGFALEVETRQIRFEAFGHDDIQEVSTRHPASKEAADREWKLVSIEKVPAEAPGQIETVGLLPVKEDRSISSSFVELADGENVFRATFENRKTRSRTSYAIRVNHLKTRML